MPGLPVVEAPDGRDREEPVPVSIPEEVSTALLSPAVQEPVDAACVELGHGPVLPWPDEVSGAVLVKTLPLLVPTDQPAVSVDEPGGDPVPVAVRVCAWLVPFPDGKGAELGVPPEVVADPPCGPVGKENDVPSEDKAVSGSPGVAVPLPVGNENDVSSALDEAPVPPGGSVEFPVGNEKDVSESDGTPVPPCGIVPLPMGNEKDVSPELEGTPVSPCGTVLVPVGKEKDASPELELGGTPAPECGTVPVPVGKENDTDPEPDGAPVAPVGAVELAVGKENDVSPGPDGRFVSPDCVGCGTVQAVELFADGGAPPELGAVSVPVCSAGVPVPDPETGLVIVTLPVGSPETSVWGRV